MCFQYIRERYQQYLRNPDQLKSDVTLIFQNAMNFNPVKHKFYKDAQRMKEVCNTTLSKVWNKIENNKLRTLDEDTFQ